jgi:hypothetical protein
LGNLHYFLGIEEARWWSVVDTREIHEWDPWTSEYVGLQTSGHSIVTVWEVVVVWRAQAWLAGFNSISKYSWGSSISNSDSARHLLCGQ